MRGATGALLCVSGVLALCCGAPQSDSGTNTNWLRQCVASEECDPTDACLCGRCTQACSADEDCPVGNVCATDESAFLQCAGQRTATCQPACSAIEDCETGRLCHHGACVDALAGLECTAGELFCEDFETPISADYTRVVTDGNEVERSPGFSPSGGSSLLSSTATAPSTAYLRAEIEAPESGEIFVSAWVEVPTELPHDVAPLAFWSSLEESWALRLTLRDSRVEVWSGTTPMTGSHPLTPGTWHCLQMGITIGDAPDGAVDLLIDGREVETANAVDTLPEGGIEAVAWGNLWAGTAGDVRVDRIVVSTSPISCFD